MPRGVSGWLGAWEVDWNECGRAEGERLNGRVRTQIEHRSSLLGLTIVSVLFTWTLQSSPEIARQRHQDSGTRKLDFV